MAGYTLGFDGGGPTDDDDTPTIPTDASDTQPDQGAAAAEPNPADAGNGQSPEAQGEPAQPGFVPGGAPGLGHAINGGVKKIVSYLMGEGAADPQTAKKFEQGIKAENPGISDDDANLLAVHKAHELGGPAAAWQMVQYNRTAYNAKQSFAKAALNGVDGKAGNVQAAAQAATQAGQHILDGSSTIFTADPGGGGNVNAQVTVPGTTNKLTFQLNPQQFNQWLDVGGHGMWDKVMEQGVPQTLQQVAGQQAQGQGAPADDGSTTTQAGQASKPAAPEDPTDTAIKMANDDNQDTDPAAPELNPNAGQQTNVGTTPSSLNLSGSDRQSTYLAPPSHSYGNDLESAGRAMFPNISDEQKRQEWMAQQQNQRSERIAKTGQAAMGAQARLNAARETGAARVQASDVSSNNRKEGQVGAAQARAGGQVDAAKINADARTQGYAQRANSAALKLAATAKTAQEAENNKNFRAAILNNPSASDAQVDGWAKKFGVKLPNAPTPQAAPPTGQQPAAQASSSSVPPAAQRQVGFTTTTAKGTFKWNGSGWEKQ